MVTNHNGTFDFVWTAPFKESLTSPALLSIVFRTNTDSFNKQVAIDMLKFGMERFFQNIQQSVKLRVGPLKQYDKYLPYWSDLEQKTLQSKRVHTFDISLPGALSISNYYNQTSNILWYLDNISQPETLGMSLLSATLLSHQLPKVPSSHLYAKTQSKLFLFSIDHVSDQNDLLQADTVVIYNSDKKTLTSYNNDVIGLVYELGTANSWLFAERLKFLTYTEPGLLSGLQKSNHINSATHLDGSFAKKPTSLLFCIYLIVFFFFNQFWLI